MNNEFSACDMATAAAHGFRDGQASIAAPVEGRYLFAPYRAAGMFCQARGIAEDCQYYAIVVDAFASGAAWSERAMLAAAPAAPAAQWAVPDGYALVPFHPTPEMIRAAEEAHMPFGDMDIALRMAILAAALDGSDGGAA